MTLQKPILTADQMLDPDAVLSVRNLSVAFSGTEVVHDVSFDLKAGKTLAIVGESGSGKSVTSLAIMRLTDAARGTITSGQMLLRRENGSICDLASAADDQLRQIRGKEIAMIFQEPMTSLNPVFPVGDQICETLVLHEGLSPRAARARAVSLLKRVRMPDAERLLDVYPHQLSGGMRQRVMIAMALACGPRLLIADEPTTALDVTIQAQILDLIQELQEETGTSVIFITHDMGVVAEVADDVVVMWKGETVEKAPVHELFVSPEKPYTRALMSAVPRLGSMAELALPQRTPLLVIGADGVRTTGKPEVQDTVDMSAPLLQVEGLSTQFDARLGFFGQVTHKVHAVENVGFQIYPGETLALVGESGSGKTTIGRTLQQLIPPSQGHIRFRGRDMGAMSPADRRALKQKIQYVFQDPFASLDPRQTVGYSIAEPMVVHGLAKGRSKLTERTNELLLQVGLTPEMADRYPHEFSGGQRQRICIARALASDPDLLIADESVSALDVSVQAQIIDLLMEFQSQRGLSYLFISHDMAVVEKISHRVAVMYLGQIVEIGPRQSVFGDPRHPYTRKLLAAVPVADPTKAHNRVRIEGEIPSTVHPVGWTPTRATLQEVAPGHWVSDAL
ncbi:ABC transporter ATP-binding protein [Primorskyibacter sedentarius]|uniref:ABC transporter ATP-binding protein n=1 Tax=Primorskyibacter sedentarius TaxID=745311 RepID=UPI003EB9833C